VRRASFVKLRINILWVRTGTDMLCFVSGSGLDPHSDGSEDPDPNKVSRKPVDRVAPRKGKKKKMKILYCRYLNTSRVSECSLWRKGGLLEGPIFNFSFKFFLLFSSTEYFFSFWVFKNLFLDTYSIFSGSGSKNTAFKSNMLPACGSWSGRIRIVMAGQIRIGWIGIYIICENVYSNQCCGSMTFWYGSGSADR
jgi:hypothetical protein